jgi:hypothetical protein
MTEIGRLRDEIVVCAAIGQADRITAKHLPRRGYR